MQGVALTQILVKVARIILWVIETYYFELTPVIFGTRSTWISTGAAAAEDGSASARDSEGRDDAGDLRQRLLPSLASEEGQEAGEDGAAVEVADDALFSWKEFYVFVGLALPAVLVCFTGWFIFELQVLAMAHVQGIPKAA